MVTRHASTGTGRDVKRKQPTHQTKVARARRNFWVRFGVWIFIVFFALSVAGGLLVFVVHPG
jgi:ABC-type microcin C transport system permease subunit YejE